MPRAKKKRAEDTGGGTSFQFVTTDDKAELRTLVRANATKYQWKHSRSSPRTLTAARHSNDVRIRSEDPSFVGSPQPHWDEARLSSRPDAKPHPDLQTLTRRQSPHEARESDVWEPGAASTISDDWSDLDVEDMVADSQSLVLHHRITLWQAFPTAFSSDSTGRLIEYNVDMVVPSLLPPIENGRDHPGASDWIQKSLTSKLLFLVWMHGATVDRRIPQAARDSLGSRAIQTNYLRAIKLTSDEMRRPEMACTDDNILAVAGLASYPLRENIHPRPEVLPSQGPMKSLQGLDSYSEVSYVHEHAVGLGTLVRMKGGLENIKLKGLAAIISYFAIFRASLELIRPPFPFMPLVPEGFSYSIGSILPVSDVFASGSLGAGFLHHWGNYPSESIQELLAVIQLICHYTVVIDEHCEGRRLQNNLAKLADQRNFTQHRLMSLPPHPRDTNTISNKDLSEACRLATIVYSLLVVFPLAISAPFQVLSRRIIDELSAVIDLDNNLNHQTEQDLLLWILFMGGIAAIGTNRRMWFVLAIANLSTRRDDLHTWEDLKQILTSFLWLPRTNDIDGVALWSEITQFMSFNLSFPARTPTTYVLPEAIGS